MPQTTAGIRELKAHLNAYLSRVEAGETVTITKRGKPFGRIVPLARSLKTRLKGLEQVGLIAWNGKKLAPLVPMVQVEGKRTVAELLLEDRE